MTSFQKIIKYCATALAIFLIVTIIGGGVTAILTVTGAKSLKNKYEENKAQLSQLEEYIPALQTPEKLYIETGAADIVIEKGEVFALKYAGADFRFKEDEGKLKIENNEGSLFSFGEVAGQLVITVPEKMSFKKVEINAGAGDIQIENLVCDSLDLDLGAGQVNVNHIKINKNADIDGGAGEITVSDGYMANADISIGVGKAEIAAYLSGNSTVEAGVGDTKLVLKGDKTDYTVITDAGIGGFSVDGDHVSDGEVIGDGENTVEIEGGIGAVRVQFEE